MNWRDTIRGDDILTHQDMQYKSSKECNMDITAHKFVVFSEKYHYNPLGVVRSLGEISIKT